MCPDCGTTTCSACGSRRTMASECSGGVSRSRSPTMTSASHSPYAASAVSRSCPPNSGMNAATVSIGVLARTSAVKSTTDGGTGEAYE